jgi:hypothetical protein
LLIAAISSCPDEPLLGITWLGQKAQQVTMWRLKFDDGKPRVMGRTYSHICSWDDKIWLAHQNKLELFQLI